MSSILALVSPQPRFFDRPTSIVGMPGIVAPITPPAFRFKRAKYHSDGAVSVVWGSFANNVLLTALRPGKAAQAFEAPDKLILLRGNANCCVFVKLVCFLGTIENKDAKSVSSTMLDPGTSGRMSFTRASPRTNDTRARKISLCK